MSSKVISDTVNFAGRAIDVHCHGVGRFDFTEIAALQLQEIEDILSSRNHQSILTLYLPQVNFEDFLKLMDTYSIGREKGLYSHIKGIALEGPLLASHGGTPHKGVWVPSKAHWKEFAECGKKGLTYVILSPDFQLLNHFSKSDKALSDTISISEILLEGGVLPTPGHFLKSDPKGSAQSLQGIFDVVRAWGHGPTMTDHLFNDMPLNFKHAWRSKNEKEHRTSDLSDIKLHNWSLSNIKETLGPVPATFIENAHEGLVKVSQNFDGEHVDLEIIKKTVSLLGAENMMMMTDSIESRRLAGRDLSMKEDSTLLYQDEGIVAAGTQGVYRQIQNMISIGLTNDQIDLITNKVPNSVLEQQRQYHFENEKIMCI